MLLITGDFNCKIGKAINGNSDKVSKGGRLLMKTVLKNAPTIVNAESKCKGLWTRVQGGKPIQRSVIDYTIVNNELRHKIKEMVIDEDKLYGAYKLENLIKRTYSDHNAIVVKTDLSSKQDVPNKKYIMTNKSYTEYKQKHENNDINTLFIRGQPQYNYNKWSGIIEKAIKDTQRTLKPKIPRKVVRQLTAIKKKLNKELKAEKKKGHT